MTTLFFFVPNLWLVKSCCLPQYQTWQWKIQVIVASLGRWLSCSGWLMPFTVVIPSISCSVCGLMPCNRHHAACTEHGTKVQKSTTLSPGSSEIPRHPRWLTMLNLPWFHVNHPKIRDLMYVFSNSQRIPQAFQRFSRILSVQKPYRRIMNFIIHLYAYVNVCMYRYIYVYVYVCIAFVFAFVLAYVFACVLYCTCITFSVGVLAEKTFTFFLGWVRVRFLGIK